MPLKKLSKNLKLEEPAKKTNSIPKLLLAGTMVRDYCNAADAEKAAKELKERLAPDLREVALDYLFQENVRHPENAFNSLKLEDKPIKKDKSAMEEEPAAVVRFEFTSKYNAADAEQVSEVFDGFEGVDVNEHVVEALVAKFDASVFLDANGNFDKKKYDKYRTAIEAVAVELDDKMPLTTEKVVMPKPDFHVQRWALFDEAQQRSISEVLPNTTRLIPLRDAVKA